MLDTDIRRGHVSGTVEAEASEKHGVLVQGTAGATATYEFDATAQGATVRAVDD